MKVGFYGCVLKSMFSFEDLRIQSSDFTLLALISIINFFSKVLTYQKKKKSLFKERIVVDNQEMYSVIK
jgi:hypothetical protein